MSNPTPVMRCVGLDWIFLTCHDGLGWKNPSIRPKHTPNTQGPPSFHPYASTSCIASPRVTLLVSSSMILFIAHLKGSTLGTRGGEDDGIHFLHALRTIFSLSTTTILPFSFASAASTLTLNIFRGAENSICNWDRCNASHMGVGSTCVEPIPCERHYTYFLLEVSFFTPSYLLEFIDW